MLLKVMTFIVALAVVIVGIALFSFLLTYPLMWALNYTFTPTVFMALFGIPQMTFWKTYALSFVTGTLFKNSAVSTSSK